MFLHRKNIVNCQLSIVNYLSLQRSDKSELEGRNHERILSKLVEFTEGQDPGDPGGDGGVCGAGSEGQDQPGQCHDRHFHGGVLLLRHPTRKSN